MFIRLQSVAENAFGSHLLVGWMQRLGASRKPGNILFRLLLLSLFKQFDREVNFFSNFRMTIGSERHIRCEREKLLIRPCYCNFFIRVIVCNVISWLNSHVAITFREQFSLRGDYAKLQLVTTPWIVKITDGVQLWSVLTRSIPTIRQDSMCPRWLVSPAILSTPNVHHSKLHECCISVCIL